MGMVSSPRHPLQVLRQQAPENQEHRQENDSVGTRNQLSCSDAVLLPTILQEIVVHIFNIIFRQADIVKADIVDLHAHEYRK